MKKKEEIKKPGSVLFRAKFKMTTSKIEFHRIRDYRNGMRQFFSPFFSLSPFLLVFLSTKRVYETFSS